MLRYSSCINHCMLYNFQDNASRTTNYHSYKSKLKTLEATDEDYGMKRRRYLSEEIAWTGNEFQKITCGNPDLDTDRISVTLPLFNYSVSSEPYKILNAEDCGKRCIVTAPRKEMCTNKKTVIEYNIGVTFWMYFAIRVFIGILHLYCIYKYCIFYCFLSNCLTFFFFSLNVERRLEIYSQVSSVELRSLCSKVRWSLYCANKRPIMVFKEFMAVSVAWFRRHCLACLSITRALAKSTRTSGKDSSFQRRLVVSFLWICKNDI